MLFLTFTFRSACSFRTIFIVYTRLALFQRFWQANEFCIKMQRSRFFTLQEITLFIALIFQIYLTTKVGSKYQYMLLVTLFSFHNCLNFQQK